MSATAPLTVLHIAPTPFFANRGCHIRIRNEIEAVQSSQLRVLLVTYGHGDDVAGLETHRIPRIPGYTQRDAGWSPYKLVADLLLFGLGLAIAWRERPAILHGHLHEGALIAWAIRTLLFWRDIRVLMDMQGSLSGELASYRTFERHPWVLRGFAFIEAFVCKLPQHIVCSSPASQHLLHERLQVPPTRTSVLPDLIPKRFFAKSEFERTAAEPLLLYSGSLLPGKGLESLLAAIEILARERPELRFALVGYPRAQAQQFLEAHGLTRRCALPGEVAYDALGEWLARADVAIEPKPPGSGEASGKVLHYMAAGLPVACFEAPTNRALLADLGYYAADESPRALAQAVLHALDAPAESVSRGEAGRNKIAAELSADRIGAQLRNLYASLQTLR